MKKYFPYIILSLALVLSVTFNVFLVARNDDNVELSFDNFVQSIVELKAMTEDVGESFGTAEFINSNGNLLTNAHVITYKKLGAYYTFDNVYIRFSFENDYREVSIIKYDTDKDIAILKLNDTNCDFKPISVGDSSKLKFNENVYAIGNLNNLGLSITKGTISNPSINVSFENVSRNVIQCDLTIADGNSGGSLLDKDGRLVGITTFRLKDNKGSVIYGIAYCIPINTVLEYIQDI